MELEDLQQDAQDTTTQDNAFDIDALLGEGGEEQQDGAAQDSQAPEEDASVTKLKEFMAKKGWNDLSQVVDWASELESKHTKLVQDLERLKAVLPGQTLGWAPQGLPVTPPGVAMPTPPPAQPVGTPIPDDPLEILIDKEKLGQFVQGLRESIKQELIGQLEQVEYAKTYQTLYQKVQQRAKENPQKFNELRPVMLELSYQMPDADFDQLWQQAEQVVEGRKKAVLEELKKELGLAGVDGEKLKGLLSRVRTTPVSTSNNVQMTPQEEKERMDLLRAIANADRI